MSGQFQNLEYDLDARILYVLVLKIRIEFSCISTIKTKRVLNPKFINLSLTEPKAKYKNIVINNSLMFSHVVALDQITYC